MNEKKNEKKCFSFDFDRFIVLLYVFAYKYLYLLCFNKVIVQGVVNNGLGDS